MSERPGYRKQCPTCDPCELAHEYGCPYAKLRDEHSALRTYAEGLEAAANELLRLKAVRDGLYRWDEWGPHEAGDYAAALGDFQQNMPRAWEALHALVTARRDEHSSSYIPAGALATVEVTDEAFAAAIAEAVQHIGAEQMASALRVSRPSVMRWARGKNLPHQALRPAVMKWLGSRPLEIGSDRAASGWCANFDECDCGGMPDDVKVKCRNWRP